MKKWVISAVVYLLLVIAGYTVYDQSTSPDSGSHEDEHSAEIGQ
ncbi:hypothetical protein ACOJQI_19615 [Bacillus salacetis]